jgi:hypothetical protein
MDTNMLEPLKWLVVAIDDAIDEYVSPRYKTPAKILVVGAAIAATPVACAAAGATWPALAVIGTTTWGTLTYGAAGVVAACGVGLGVKNSLTKYEPNAETGRKKLGLHILMMGRSTAGKTVLTYSLLGLDAPKREGPTLNFQVRRGEISGSTVTLLIGDYRGKTPEMLVQRTSDDPDARLKDDFFGPPEEPWVDAVLFVADLLPQALDAQKKQIEETDAVLSALETKYSSVDGALQSAFAENCSYLGESGVRCVIGSFNRRASNGTATIKAARLVLTKLDVLQRAVELGKVHLESGMSPKEKSLLMYRSLSDRLETICVQYGVQSFQIEVVNALDKGLEETVTKPLLAVLGG